jgi:DNA mismatch endonuclease (patch repair protein)
MRVGAKNLHMGSIRPAASSLAVRRRMQATAQRDNSFERQVRSELHKQGLRFRIHYRVSALHARSIDIALVGSKTAIFVDGCFWHGCPKHATFPKSNRDWWLQKIRANKKRDLDTNARLKSAGWKVLRFWEHDPPHELSRIILRQFRKRKLKTARKTATASAQAQATARKRQGSRTKL